MVDNNNNNPKLYDFGPRGKDAEPLPEELLAHLIQPTPGTYAYTARIMAKIMPDFDWDAWKDEMKEGDLD